LTLFLIEWVNYSSAVPILLPVIVQHMTESSGSDLETFENILRLKLKGMHFQLYMDAIAQVLANSPAFPSAGMCKIACD
jgi:hypothetical protein